MSWCLYIVTDSGSMQNVNPPFKRSNPTLQNLEWRWNQQPNSAQAQRCPRSGPSFSADVGCPSRSFALQNLPNPQTQPADLQTRVVRWFSPAVPTEARTESVEERGAMDATATELDFEAFEEISYATWHVLGPLPRFLAACTSAIQH